MDHTETIIYEAVPNKVFCSLIPFENDINPEVGVLVIIPYRYRAPDNDTVINHLIAKAGTVMQKQNCSYSLRDDFEYRLSMSGHLEKIASGDKDIIEILGSVTPNNSTSSEQIAAVLYACPLDYFCSKVPDESKVLCLDDFNWLGKDQGGFVKNTNIYASLKNDELPLDNYLKIQRILCSLGIYGSECGVMGDKDPEIVRKGYEGLIYILRNNGLDKIKDRSMEVVSNHAFALMLRFTDYCSNNKIPNPSTIIL